MPDRAIPDTISPPVPPLLTSLACHSSFFMSSQPGELLCLPRNAAGLQESGSIYMEMQISNIAILVIKSRGNNPLIWS